MIRRALHIVGSPDKLTNHSVLEVLAGLHALELVRVALQAVGELPQAIFVVIPVRLRDRCADLFRLEVLAAVRAQVVLDGPCLPDLC